MGGLLAVLAERTQQQQLQEVIKHTLLGPAQAAPVLVAQPGHARRWSRARCTWRGRSRPGRAGTSTSSTSCWSWRAWTRSCRTWTCTLPPPTSPSTATCRRGPCTAGAAPPTLRLLCMRSGAHTAWALVRAAAAQERACPSCCSAGHSRRGVLCAMQIRHAPCRVAPLRPAPLRGAWQDLQREAPWAAMLGQRQPGLRR